MIAFQPSPVVQRKRVRKAAGNVQKLAFSLRNSPKATCAQGRGTGTGEGAVEGEVAGEGGSEGERGGGGECEREDEGYVGVGLG